MSNNFKYKSNIPISDEQKLAIDAKQGNILISAAAGSGKTSVMTERISRRLISGDISLNNSLILTFTNAASQNMSDELSKKLLDYLEQAQEAGDKETVKRIKAQLDFVPAAHIETIHAFCLSLIRTFPNLLLDANGNQILEVDFSTADEALIDELFNTALDNVLENFYYFVEKLHATENLELELDHKNEEQSLTFEGKKIKAETALEFLRIYSGKRSGADLKDLLKSIYFYLRSLPDYFSVFNTEMNNLKLYAENFATSPHIKYLFQGLELRVNAALRDIKELKKSLSNPSLELAGKTAKTNHEDYLNIYYKLIDDVNKIKELLKILNSEASYANAWDEIYGIAQRMEFAKPRRASIEPGLELGLRGDEDISIFDKDMKKIAKKELKNLAIDCVERSFSDLIYFLNINTSDSTKKNCKFPAIVIWSKPISEIAADINMMLPYIEIIYLLLLNLDSEYSKMKARRNVIDFSDYEHFALEIIRTEEGRNYCRTKFKEVYIDEYQDTSSIEEAILHEICPRNTFMVGDVKQSIYRFRNARPEIFLKKAQQYKMGDSGEYFVLSKNFRSEDGVLQAINEVFSKIMLEDFSGINYLDGHEMNTGRQGTRTENRVEFLINLQAKDDNEYFMNYDGSFTHPVVRSLSATKLGDFQARNWVELKAKSKNIFHLAKEIIRLHREEQVDFRDIAVLARGNAVCDEISTIFTQIGIPHSRTVGRSIKDNFVLENQLALLQSLDNSKADIPLATLMISDMLVEGFNESELLKIRIFQKERGGVRSNFYDAVKFLASAELDFRDEFFILHEKLKRFLERYEHWRKRASEIAISSLISEIWYSSDYLDKVNKLDGSLAVETLENFLEEIREREKYAKQGLDSIVRSLEIEIEEDNRSSGDSNTKGEGVKIITFHKSKGLAYKYVFIMDLDKTLQDKDKSQKISVSEELGIGFDIANVEDFGVYSHPSHLKLAKQEQEHQRFLTEEICLLYVAMSRAREKVYLCGNLDFSKNYERLNTLLDLSNMAELALPAYIIANLKSYQEFILVALLALDTLPSKKVIELFKDRPESPSDVDIDLKNSNWSFRSLNNTTDLLDAWQYIIEFWQEDNPLNNVNVKGTGKYEKNWSLAEFYKYPEQEFVAIPKLSVSEIKRHSSLSEFKDEQDTMLRLNNLKNLALLENVEKYSILSRDKANELLEVPDKSELDSKIVDEPVNINLEIMTLDEILENSEGDTLSPRLLGIALHSVMNYIDLLALDKAENKSMEFKAQVERFRDLGFVSDREYNAVLNFENEFIQFSKSNIAQELLDLKKTAKKLGKVPRIYKELPFTFRYSLVEKQGIAIRESLVQGVIDLWYESENGIVLLDYKSDILPKNSERAREMLLERYGVQLNIYARALEKSLKTPLRKILIWSIRLAEEFSFTREDLGLE